MASGIVLFANGKAALYVTGVKRNADNTLMSGHVENGAWDFSIRGGEVIARASGWSGGYIVNRWRDPGYLEMPADPQWRGDYNDVLCAAQQRWDLENH